MPSEELNQRETTKGIVEQRCNLSLGGQKVTVKRTIFNVLPKWLSTKARLAFHQGFESDTDKREAIPCSLRLRHSSQKTTNPELSGWSKVLPRIK